MKTIKCGIIGCGVIAPSHIESYNNLFGIEVKWACDLEKVKAEKVAEKYNINEITTDYMDILNDPEVDCVSICTDHGSHGKIVSSALDHKKHVICEKALGASPECLADMTAAHSRNNEMVFTGIFQHRFERITRLIKKYMDDGSFGTITTINLSSSLLRTNEYYKQDEWRGTWAEEGGSLLINQSIHYLDLVSWLSGGVEELSAKCENLTHQGVIETEDTAVIIMKFKNGYIGSVTATASSVEGWRHVITVSGTEGYLEFCNDEVTYFKFSDKVVSDKFNEEIKQCREEKQIDSNKAYYGEGHPAQIKDFIEAVREGRKPFIAAESAKATVDIVHACYESSRTGKWIKL